MAALEEESALIIGPVEVRPGASLALVAGRPLMLSVRELMLLTELARRRDRVVSRAELHAVVWGGRYRKGDRSVDVYVSKLRAKLVAAAPDWCLIHTHFGFGYRLSAETSQRLHSNATDQQQTGDTALRASPVIPNRTDKENQ